MLKVLDLFCGEGGASVGYHMAGFEVTGVDISPQSRYPSKFVQADALTVSFDGFDVIHASPPCQRWTVAQKLWNRYHPDFITPIRERLIASGKLYIIENVPGAPLRDPVTLCGSMFHLTRLRRHRLFESNFPIVQPICVHTGKVISVYGHPGGYSRRDGSKRGDTADWSQAMGIHWMSAKGLAQAIPPAYTEYIGKQLILYLLRKSDKRLAAYQRNYIHHRAARI